MTQSYFVISLDFELFWGMSDKYTLEAYGPRVFGERTAIPRMLELFTHHKIHATWATVGMLMARNKTELFSYFPSPERRPHYRDIRLSSYYHIEQDGVGEDEHNDPYHYGETLLKMVLATPNQEIGNHTFSHYYAMDGAADQVATLSADFEAYNALAHTYGIKTESMVFPRNQSTTEALRVAKRYGINAYRGNEDHFLYRAREDGEQSLFVRALRLIDHYVNLSGYHTYPLPRTASTSLPLNIPASRFFRPFMPRLAFLESLRIRRIKNAMTHAAENGEVFHLWWHPHNVGIHQTENFRNLNEILEHFAALREKYGMQSASMRDLAKIVAEQTP